VNRHRKALITAAALVLALLALPAAASAASPVLRIAITSQPTNFVPNSHSAALTGLPGYSIAVSNIGSMPTEEPYAVTVELPPGIAQVGTGLQTITISGAEFNLSSGGGVIRPGEIATESILVEVGDLPEGSTATASASVTGGGAPDDSASTTTTITSSQPTFDFLPGAQNLQLTDSDGSPVTQASSHPDQFTLDFGFPTRQNSLEVGTQALAVPAGGLRDLHAILPAGLIVNPAATPVRCSENQLETHEDTTATNCPLESQVGVANILFTPAGDYYVSPLNSAALYNMKVPRGAPAEFGFNAAGVFIYIHFDGGVHAGDYRLTADADDVLARFTDPVVGFQTQLWGDPSAAVHDRFRGRCADATYSGPPCAVEPQSTPLLTMPSACSDSLRTDLSADSWGEPGLFRSTSFLATAQNGNPTPVTGCDSPELHFDPTLKARPTTNVADSPSGLEVDLKIPQHDELGSLSTPNLRKAEVTLPPGLVLNPSSANGLAGCSSDQIGVNPVSGLANGAHSACPDASKLGTVEVETPLLEHPLPGYIYLAAPYDNPFDSLLAIYVVVDDPDSGVLVKLSGHVIPDPQTGRLTAVFDDNPQLPFEDFKLDFFGGPGGPLRTPATCNTYSTTSQMTPWSAPASGPPATPSDTYAITKAPAGGCAKDAASLPNSPSFDAGSVSLLAGRYTPFVLNLRRNDGTQEFSSITMTPPPGLLGRLAGTPYCSEADLSAAAGKSGNAEKANPSCPGASQVGTVEVGAGAGPAPLYTQGKVYLAGPYKGAPLSLAIVTPATAGPYDLGTVVVRTALNVDPESARITAVSDPVPQILQGIPLDVRSIALKLDKPEFTLNPTSCNPFSLTGEMHSVQGQTALLENPFQVAECARLKFKPGLSLKLKGGTHRGDHPALRAVVTYPKGNYANIARARVSLPHSEFLDQGHIRTVCTRVQFAADACPAASVYGRARAVTPLLAEPLEGPVYLRSSSNQLPDLVADLRGQIHVVLDGRIDSARGGIRTSFESVPDAPVSKFTLSMQGGKKGLLVNSRNICKSPGKATALFDGQNGKIYDSSPKLRNGCKVRHAKRHHSKKHRG
jgi:hypothetical protein